MLFLSFSQLPAFIQIAGGEIISTARLGADMRSSAYGFRQPMPLPDKVNLLDIFFLLTFLSLALIIMDSKVIL